MPWLSIERCGQTNPWACSRNSSHRHIKYFLSPLPWSLYLLVERSMPHFSRFKRDIETMTADLGLVDAQACPVPVAVNGRKVLLKMLALLDQGCSPEDAERLVPDISTIIGGENTTRAYLGRRGTQETPGQATSQDLAPHQHQQQEPIRESRENEPSLLSGSVVSTFGSVLPNAGDDTTLMPYPEPSDFNFDFDEFQLSDSYDLFGWDMTGLLSGAVASANRLRMEGEIDSAMLS